MSIKMVSILSGGLDSAVATVVAAKALGADLATEVLCVNMSYGSKHGAHEQQSARWLTDHWGMTVGQRVNVNLYNAMAAAAGHAGQSVSTLMASNGTPLPEGHYAEETMRSTVVPGRNLAFISVAACIAESVAIRTGELVDLVIGVHQGDHHIYPDCRPDFIEAAASTVWHSTERRVRLRAPLLDMDKAGIVKVGAACGVPFHLTRTCYGSRAKACGKCGACTERLEAFAKNGLKDPIEYEEVGG